MPLGLDERLPNELLAEIFEYLITDLYSLASCARASKRIYPIAQGCCFRTLSLVLFPGGHTQLYDTGVPLILGTTSNFLELLAKSPHIAEYVVQLNIYERETQPYARNIWSSDEEVCAILPRLTRLTALAFPADIDSFRYFTRRDPSHMTPSLVRIVTAALALEQLAVLDFGGTFSQFPDHMLCDLPRPPLRRFVANIRRDQHSRDAPSMRARARCKPLEVIELALHIMQRYSQADGVAWAPDLLTPGAGCCIALGSVRRLEVRFVSPMRIRAGEEDGLKELLCLFPDVEELYLQPNPNVAVGFREDTGAGCGASVVRASDEARHGTAPPRLAPMPRLRALTIQFELYTGFAAVRLGAPIVASIDEWAFASGLPYVAAFLRRLLPERPDGSVGASGLRRLVLVLELKINGINPEHDYRDLSHRIPTWAEVVDVLVSGGFPALFVVALEISVPSFVKQEERMEIREKLRCTEAFARFRAHGICVLI